MEYNRFRLSIGIIARQAWNRRALHVLFRAGLIAASLGLEGPGAFAGAPVRQMLGRAPIPESTDERSVSGTIKFGRYIPTGSGAAASRPDGSGTASNLYQISLLDALSGNRGGFLGDALFISDRDRGGSFTPTQMNYLLGIGFRRAAWRIQFDREEIIPLDREGRNYRYWDVRVGVAFETFLMGERKRMGRPMPRGGPKPRGARIRGELAASYFLHNNSFPARWDLTGNAYLRYTARAEIGSRGGAMRLFADADFLTDEHTKRYRPANLDLSWGIAFGAKGADIIFSRVSNEILDRSGFNAYYLLTFSYPLGAR